MNLIYLLGTIFGILFFLLLGLFIVLFKAFLLELRSRILNNKAKAEICNDYRMAKLVANLPKINAFLNFSFITSFIATGILIYPLLYLVAYSFNFSHPLDHPLLDSILLFLAILFVQYFVIEMAIRGHERFINFHNAKYYALPIILFSKILYPFLWLVRFLGSKIVNTFTLKHEEHVELDVLEDFIREDLVSEQPSFSPELLEIVENAIRLPKLDVSDVLLPRRQIDFLDISKPIQENIDKAKRSGHTRFPLCEGSIDNCIGFVHIKDIFQYQGELDTLDLSKFKYPVVRFRDDTPLEDALRKLMKFKLHLALIDDEFGSTVGLITLEDILEELVGSIEDEFDEEETLIRPIGRDAYKVSGLTPIHDLESVFNIEIENKDVSTFGGLVTSELGRLPEKNESFELLGLFRIRIDEVTKQRIISATIRLLPH